MPIQTDSLTALAAYIASRREVILDAWRTGIALDPKLTTGASLPRAQLHDHIPALLEDFERRLTARGTPAREEVENAEKGDAAAHGLHRWQQGFDLAEVTHELGRLNECVVEELECYAAARPALEAAAMAEGRRIWAALCSVAISASINQYFKLQQLEAASHVADLEHALESLRELEAQRAQLWQQAAHDLRGNLGVVVNATVGLTSTRLRDDAAAAFLGLLDRNVRALHRLLEDVTSLARLQGGQEHRSVAPMDATLLLQEIAEGLQPLAQERHLYLRFDGPATCAVDGDEIKVRRIVQNLVLNAIKYTRQGGVAVSWGSSVEGDEERWFIQVRDTGPGFHAGPGSRIVQALEVATDRSDELDADAESGDVTHASREQSRLNAPSHDTRNVHQQPGEGLGLSIVKRLCELLDATMELESKIDVGTTIRVLLPRRYGAG